MPDAPDLETKGAVEALQKVKRSANPRTVFWTLSVTAIVLGLALLVAWWVLPTPAEIAALRAERDALASNVALLNQRGARADLRRCGTGQLCVRVDLKAPRYGESSDYLVIRGTDAMSRSPARARYQYRIVIRAKQGLI